MATEEKIEKIEKVSKNSEVSEDALVEDIERKAPNQERFEELMGAGSQQRSIDIHSPAGEKSSLMDQIRDINSKVDGVTKASPDQLVAQTRDVIKQIEDVKTQLASPDLQLKDSVQNLLKNKLSHIDESLKVAMNRAGLEYSPVEPGQKSSLVAPIERFIGFLTHGQYQLQKLSNDIEMMHLNKTELAPASMLAIQMKVGYVQQEIEFFTSILNKALESTKTIMNVQI